MTKKLDLQNQQSHDSTLPLVSVLFITYLRFELLKKNLTTFLENCSYPNLQLVVADDGSPPEIQNKISQLPFHDFVLSPTNRGLGANTNEGLRRCRGDFILQLQDDWQCLGPSNFLATALEILKVFGDIGLIRLDQINENIPPIKETRATTQGLPLIVFENNPSSQDFVYSDRPHLKRRELIDALGPYKESRWMQYSELDMRDRFRAQTQYLAATAQSLMVFKNVGENVSLRTPTPRERLGTIKRALIKAITAPIKGLLVFNKKK